MRDFMAINGPNAPTPTQLDLNKIARIAAYLLSYCEETDWAAIQILCDTYHANKGSR